MNKKLTQPQKDLLGALSFDEWRTAPDLTAGNTIISLQDRKLIKIRTPAHISGRILAGYEMIRVKEGADAP